jgi:carboxyl-terminal processing protease
MVTEVVLKIAREGENEFLSVPIIRDKIEIPTLDSELRDDGVFVISLYNFGGTAITEMRKALRNFIESKSNKLIIDLRGNPGGYLEASVNIASWFLPIGKTVVTEDYGDKKEKVVHRSKGYNIIDDKYKVAILVNGGSASASEILAGALREHNKAVLIGTQTYGKGSVQELLDVTNDTTIKITIARWLTPNGISISHNGLKPDLEIKMTREDIENDTDPQLDAAVNYLLTGELVKQEAATSTKTVEGNEKIE